MRLKLFILVFSFANLLVTPTLLTLQGSGDISFFISLNEEENSEKNNVSFGEYIFDESGKTIHSLDAYYSQSFAHYVSNYKSVTQKIVSPPPDFKIES
ncbi:hypothetical protein [Psychroflexus sediminis]|uniref:Uncharacterized protein n=1 Tax=Psychroflexus sediminis TaxID=470826 RepID=A0A1G7X3R7_9FLAO|nr:hypothetical protein [Psychroflexus sediminis]SDG78815.1 hypothetical protein SAMN04488027_10769 [Psychroflexus sediminis]